MSLLVWACLCALAFVLELLTGTFFLFVLAAACLPAGFLAWLGTSVTLQVLSFSVTAVLGYLALKKLRRPSPEVRAQDVGAKVEVLSRNPDGSYRVRYRGSEWDADAPNLDAEPGSFLTVRAVQGIRLQCSN